MRGFMFVLFLILGTITLLFAFSERELNWLALAGAALFYTKALLSFALRRYSVKSTSQKESPAAVKWLFVMFGYLLSAALCLLSGISGEGWIGFIGAPVLLLTAAVFAFIAKKSKTLEKPSNL